MYLIGLQRERGVNMHKALGIVVGFSSNKCFVIITVNNILPRQVMPKEHHLGYSQLECRVGFLMAPYMAAKSNIWVSGAELNNAVLRTEASGPILP